MTGGEEMRLTVIGTGYLGATHAACMAELGRSFLDAGAGFGGGCLPKDLRALAAVADESGGHGCAGLLRQVDDINLRCRTRVADRVKRAVGGTLVGIRVAVLGAAFKPGSDDVRDSPSLAIAQRLSDDGADVVVCDPVAADNARRARPDLTRPSGLAEAVKGADAVVLATPWPQFRSLAPRSLEGLVARRILIDARNTLDPAVGRSAGWTFHAMGRA
jgi:UDPglucose 6-dehydrogenase